MLPLNKGKRQYRLNQEGNYSWYTHFFPSKFIEDTIWRRHWLTLRLGSIVLIEWLLLLISSIHIYGNYWRDIDWVSFNLWLLTFWGRLLALLGISTPPPCTTSYWRHVLNSAKEIDIITSSWGHFFIKSKTLLFALHVNFVTKALSKCWYCLYCFSSNKE